VSALSIENLAVSFGSTVVLTDLNLAVGPRSVTAVLGASGSGKTTLLRTIAGFERAQAGRIELNGRLVDGPGVHLAPERRRLGYVAQEGALFPHLTVARNVAFGLPRRARSSGRVEELLGVVGLADLRHRYPHELSGGQQQRVALARALALEPTLVLLDEPFASLDAALRASVRDDVFAVLRAAQTAVVLVTHDQQEALSVADQVAVLRTGEIVQYGPPRELYEHPVDPELARFLGDANLLDAEVLDGIARTAVGRLPTTASFRGPAIALVRPEQIELTAGHATTGLSGRVVAQTYHGPDSLVIVEPHTPGGADLVRVRIAGPMAHPIGTEVHLTATGTVAAGPADRPS
jgi:iron(III) transport system ATP-binding protein